MIVLTANSTSLTDNCGCFAAMISTDSDFVIKQSFFILSGKVYSILTKYTKKRAYSPFFWFAIKPQRLVLRLLHLLLDQVTDSGRTLHFSVLVFHITDCLLLFIDVLGLDGEIDDAVLAVDRDDLGFYLITFVEHVARIFNFVTADFRSLQNSFNLVGQGNDGRIGINGLNRTSNNGAFLVQLNEFCERIAIQLLDAQGDTLTLRIDRQDNGVDLVAFLVLTYSFLARLVPGDIRQVNQTVDAAIQTDEDTEVSDGLDLTGDLVAFVELAGELFPGVRMTLLDTQGDTTTLFVDVQNHNFNFVTHLNHFGRMDVLVGPIHFGNVNQTFHTFFQLSKAAVVGQVGYACGNTGTFRVTCLDINPGIRAQLLQTQGYTVTLTVELQNLNVNLVAHIDDFARMLDAFPSHIGDVQQTIHTAQVGECAVVGEVLDDTFCFHAFLQGRQQRFALGTVFSFQNRTTGNNYVVALLIQLDNFEFEFLAFQVCGVTDRTHINQGARQERADAVNVNGETTFDLAVDNAFDHCLLFESLLQVFPGFSALRFLTGQTGFTKTIFHRVESYINLISDLDIQASGVVKKLGNRNHAFGFQAGMNSYPVAVDVNDCPFDNRTGLHINFFQAFFEKFSKALAHLISYVVKIRFHSASPANAVSSTMASSGYHWLGPGKPLYFLSAGFFSPNT